ncbi:MAG: DUF2244 domain-containing protein [Paracoccaceae bacterium]
MPYEWLPPAPPTQRLRLWPFRSLPKTGFVWFVGATAALISLPLFAVLGTAVLWGLLPFLVAAIAGLWLALTRSWRDGEIVEDLTLSPDSIHLLRRGPRGRRQEWQANPHWTRLTLHRTGGPVPNYLTLRGNGREVELGAFLSEEERIRLHGDLAARLAQLH